MSPHFEELTGTVQFMVSDGTVCTFRAMTLHQLDMILKMLHGDTASAMEYLRIGHDWLAQNAPEHLKEVMAQTQDALRRCHLLGPAT